MRTKVVSDLNNYKILRNQVVNSIRINKKQYYESNIKNNKSNPRIM